MFVEIIDKLVSEFQQRLGTKVSVPWGWVFTKLAALLSRFPTGVTKAIMFAELECSWRKIEKLHSKGTMHAADSLRSIVLSKQLSPEAVFEVFLREVKNVEGTRTRIGVVEEYQCRQSSADSGFSMEMYLHQKLYEEVNEIMAHGYKLRFTGCRMVDGRGKTPLRLLPSESFVVLVHDEAVQNFHQNSATLEGLEQLHNSQYIKDIIKVKVTEITPEESIHHQNGQTVNRITVVVTDDVGIQAKFQLWEEYLVMANLFEEGDMLYIKQCFLVPDEAECFVLEYGPETIIFCQPLTQEEEVLPSQKDGSKMLHIAKDNKGMLDCSMYPERLDISEIKQNMTNITLCGQVLSIGVRKLYRGDSVQMVKYDVRVQDETGICSVVVVEMYKSRTMLHCGQFMLMKNLHVSTDYSMAVTLNLFTNKGGEFWNLSSLQGWLATSSLCTVTSLASLNPECTQCIVKGIISHIQSRDGDNRVLRVHCSCQGLVLEDMDGQLRCEKCQTKGMVEMSVTNAPKLFDLDRFWCWQYNLCITIMESEQHQVRADITNDVAEKLLQLSARQLRELGSDGQRRVFECILGQECVYGLSNFKGDLLVGVVYQT